MSGKVHDTEIAVLTQAVESVEENQSAMSERFEILARDTNRQIRDVYTKLESTSADTNAKFDRLLDRQTQRDKTNWPVLISLAGLMFAALAGGWLFIKLQTENTVIPVAGAIAVNQKAIEMLVSQAEKRDARETAMRSDLDKNGERDAVSETDRARLNQHAVKIDETIHSLERDFSTYKGVITQKLTEIETQFHAADEIRNIQHAEQQRTNNILLQISQGKHPIEYPTAPVYEPHVARPDGATQN